MTSFNAIDELKNNSASGPDGLAAIFLKKCKNALATPLFHLMEEMPRSWHHT